MTYDSSLRFTWDPAKNEANRRKHGIGFEDAMQLFLSGVDYLEIFDETHSDQEDRFIAIGPILRGTVLVVWTEQNEDIIRIISARWATAREDLLYRTYTEESR